MQRDRSLVFIPALNKLVKPSGERYRLDTQAAPCTASGGHVAQRRLYRRKALRDRIQIRQSESGHYYPVVVDLKGNPLKRGPNYSTELEADAARLTYRRTGAWRLS